MVNPVQEALRRGVKEALLNKEMNTNAEKKALAEYLCDKYKIPEYNGLKWANQEEKLYRLLIDEKLIQYFFEGCSPEIKDLGRWWFAVTFWYSRRSSPLPFGSHPSFKITCLFAKECEAGKFNPYGKEVLGFGSCEKPRPSLHKIQNRFRRKLNLKNLKAIYFD